MRKIVILMVLALTVTTTFAQKKPIAAHPQHFKFKGIPIDGTAEDFASKLEKDSFKCLSTENGNIILTGYFAGYPKCGVIINRAKQRDIVWMVTAIIPQSNDWASLELNYKVLRNLLTDKYGKPQLDVAKFNTTVTPQTDDDKMFAVKSGKCGYLTNYDTPLGNIVMEISYAPNYYYIALVYADKKNYHLTNTTKTTPRR